MRVAYTFFVFCSLNSAIMGDVTFLVAKVDKSTKKHTEMESLSNEDLARWTAKGQKLSLENFQTNYPLAEGLNGENHRIKNAFVATVFQAYSYHYPLELSVEDIWVTIAQGIGIHLNENAEKYRQLMVSHEGKKTLNIAVDNHRLPDSARPKYGDKSVPAIDWPAAVHLMAEKIKNDMKPELATLLTSSFSNTTSVEQVVFDCTLMDSVKSYYDYRFTLLCGLPQVTLRGSPEDFQQIIDQIGALRAIFTDLQWWFDILLPHLKQLKASAEGSPDIDWWGKICHVISGSGSSSLTGWLVDFVPYVSDGKGHYYKARQSCDYINGIDFGDFSESITQTDFTLNNNGRDIKMKLIAGFLGTSQNPDTGALRPSLGWITALLDRNNESLLSFIYNYISKN